jgi:hypothetical protein
MEWFDGLYRGHNCLTHRLGRVRMVGVKPSGVPLTEAEFSNSTDSWASRDLWAHLIRERYGRGSKLWFAPRSLRQTSTEISAFCDSSNCPHPGQLQRAYSAPALRRLRTGGRLGTNAQSQDGETERIGY